MIGSGAALLVLIVIAAGMFVWQPWVPPFEPAIPLPDTLSIAVLPFKNLRGDPEQEYLADGLSEPITCARRGRQHRPRPERQVVGAVATAPYLGEQRL